MLEEITQARPKDIMEFIYNYAKKDIGMILDYLESRQQVKRMDSHPTSEEEMTKEQEEMMARKIQ